MIFDSKPSAHENVMRDKLYCMHCSHRVMCKTRGSLLIERTDVWTIYETRKASSVSYKNNRVF